MKNCRAGCKKIRKDDTMQGMSLFGGLDFLSGNENKSTDHPRQEYQKLPY
ncbi:MULTISPECIES: hypothetical protein [Chryseobacterium]|nr:MULTISPECIES: hypothetical protein [Chryseobacterium]